MTRKLIARYRGSLRKRAGELSMRRLLSFLLVAVIVAIALWRQSPLTRSDASRPSATSGETSSVPSATSAPSAEAAPSSASRSSSASANSAPVATPKSGKGFRDRAHLDDHFAKHGGEFQGVSKAQYLAMAQALRDAPVGGNILEIIRPGDGVVSRFDKRNGAFLAFDRDGTIRTFFKPNDGEAYFRRQAKRAPN